MFRTAKVLLTAAALTATLPAVAQDVDPAIAGAIKARQAHMQLLAFNLGTIGAMAQGKAEYNAEAAQAAADNIVALTTIHQAAYWPEGSDSVSVASSNALPALWADFPGVMAKGTAMSEAAVAMQAAAGTDLASLQGAMGALGASCGGCHEAFRKPRQ